MQIGIDLGGTKIEAIALDATGRELARLRVVTPRAYTDTIVALGALVTQLETVTGQHGTVGLGIPGAVTPDTGLVKNANSVWLIGRPLGADLAALLQREVRLENDANCFALSEATDGAAAGAEVVFGVIMGTGVGGGIIVRGRSMSGRNLIAGEWGHNPLPWPQPDELPGPACYCGKHGCIESWVSGPAVAADHQRVTGQALPTPDIIAAAEFGAHDALATRARFIGRATRGLATVINLLDPDVIVLGGGLSNVPRLADDIAAQLPAWVFSDRVHTSIVRNRHGDSSGVRGAAWLWPAS